MGLAKGGTNKCYGRAGMVPSDINGRDGEVWGDLRSLMKSATPTYRAIVITLGYLELSWTVGNLAIGNLALGNLALGNFALGNMCLAIMSL